MSRVAEGVSGASRPGRFNEVFRSLTFSGMKLRSLARLAVLGALAGVLLAGCRGPGSSNATPTVEASGTAATVAPSEAPPTATGTASATPAVPTSTSTVVAATTTVEAIDSLVATGTATQVATAVATSPPGGTPVATSTPTPPATPTPLATATMPPVTGVQVPIRGYGYQPTKLEIAVGTTVTWVNGDPVPHDADAADGSWDGPLLSDGESWSRTFSTAGEFLVTCSIHPYMQGLVTVE